MPTASPSLTFRAARLQDVPAMHALIGYWAERKLLLPRSMGELYESIRDFVVVEAEVGGLVGCAAPVSYTHLDVYKRQAA